VQVVKPIIWVLLAAAAAATQPEAAISVDAGKPAAYRVPRTIYGTFLEPIGRSIYGGLWAEELENPSFEDNLWSAGEIAARLKRQPELGRASGLGLPLPWEPLDEKQGMRYEPRWGDAANSYRSLLIMGLPAGETGVRQQVYLPVDRAGRYGGSVWAKWVSGPRMIEVSLRKRNRGEAVLARARLALEGGEWKEYRFSLEMARGGLAPLEPADFAIAVANETRVLVDEASLVPADAIDGMDPEMIEMARALRTPLVRYGGNFTSGYHWRDGVGPPEKRVSMLNQSWGIPEYNQFGTDEFLRFCERIGAEPQIALNLGSGTEEEAADWVRYVNARWGKHGGGLLWELGNELYGKWQIGYPTRERIAERTRRFSAAVRAADGKARLIATGQDPDQFAEWNSAQMTNEPGAFEYLSTHFVVGPEVERKDAPADFVARATLALPVGLERRLRAMREQIEADERWRGRLKIAFTEWLFWGRDEGTPHFHNLGGALCAAGFLNTLMRVADFTPVADMTGLVEFGGIWKKRGRVYGVPAYWAFRLYSESGAVQPVETQVTVERYDVVEGNRRIPEIRGVPYLDVVAALDEAGERLMVFAVNRDAGRDYRARISIHGFAAEKEGLAWTLGGGALSEANDEERPEAVRPVESAVAAGEEFEHVFPRASVTRVELRRRD
jgi:alpha-N-arabinofuranosidase